MGKKIGRTAARAKLVRGEFKKRIDIIIEPALSPKRVT
jgi:hypothetical protein